VPRRSSSSKTEAWNRRHCCRHALLCPWLARRGPFGLPAHKNARQRSPARTLSREFNQAVQFASTQDCTSHGNQGSERDFPTDDCMPPEESSRYAQEQSNGSEEMQMRAQARSGNRQGAWQVFRVRPGRRTGADQAEEGWW